MCTLCIATGRTAELTTVAGFTCTEANSSSDNPNFGATSVYTNDQIAHQLTNAYWGGSDRSFNVGVGGSISVNITNLTLAGQNLARQALELWSDTTGLNFTFTSGSALIYFDDTDAWSAYNWSNISGLNITYSYVNVGTSWINYYGSGLNTYSLQTYIHEIGHALGLGHAGNYNGSATYGVNNYYANDSWQATLMSYFSQTENTYVNASYAYAITPQVADVIAIRNLYGTSGSTRTGNTTYGDNANSGDLMQTISSMNSYISYTIVDDGGTDALDYSSSSANQTIDLREEGISSVRGYIGNLIIARGSVIENAFGGSGDDVLAGNGADNSIFGGAGADKIRGEDGNDRVYDGIGNDTVSLGNGDDYVLAGGGRDHYDGGPGDDYISYFNSPNGVTVDLSIDTVKGSRAADDTIFDFESVSGSSTGNDRIFGSNESNTIRTYSGNDRAHDRGGDDRVFLGAGDDYLKAGGGRDHYSGGIGSDYISYFDSPKGVIIDLKNSTVARSRASDDTISGFESASGSKDGDDIVLGSNGTNTVRTYGGNDRVYDRGGSDKIFLGEGDDYVKAGGGRDSYHGEAGNDYISYYDSPSGVKIDLLHSTVSRSRASDDTISGFESASGSFLGSDIVWGTDSANTIRSYGGDDQLFGRKGNDRLFGGDGSDILHGGIGSDILYGGADADLFVFNLGEEQATIKDFEKEIDSIQFGGFGYSSRSEAYSFATQFGLHVLFNFDSGDTLLVENTSKIDILDDLVVL